VSKQARVNLLQSFIAVVAGNAVYFLLMPHLPPVARHDPARLDLGVIIDFWFCLAFLGLIKTLARRKATHRQEHEEKH
jgi:H+/gluconate symporter-like permease